MRLISAVLWVARWGHAHCEAAHSVTRSGGQGKRYDDEHGEMVIVRAPTEYVWEVVDGLGKSSFGLGAAVTSQDTARVRMSS